jgi:hypothetical protein
MALVEVQEGSLVPRPHFGTDGTGDAIDGGDQRTYFVAAGEPSRGLPLWPDEDREEKYGEARAGPTGWIRLRLKQKA